jgi:ubiquinol-cytochrome c reductase cytochrome c subunit
VSRLRTPLRMPRSLVITAAVASAVGAIALASAGTRPARGAQDSGLRPAAQVERGRRLFQDGCASCHGENAQGRAGRGPSLRGAGEIAADFYLRTGRMPLEDSGDEPVRSESPYSNGEIRALVAYVGSLGGPAIPNPQPARGSLSEGLELFTDNCAGCHQVVGQGGITTRGIAPSLASSSALDVAEAMRVGPYVMPRFERFSDEEVDSLARYVAFTQSPDDRGGWSIGHIGPLPEGMVAWLLAGFSLLLVVRLLGERTE